MSEEIKTVETAQEEERAHIITLKKPYTFERQEYTEIDLSGLDNLTIRDAIDAQKKLFNQNEVATSLLCETTTAFAMEIAARASGLPIEFFKLMPRRAGKQVQAEVVGYINTRSKEKGAGNSTMQLEKPYYFNGEQFTEFDLSPIADMSVLNESAAENIMAREGFIITENTFNYLYACIIASMAVNKPRELFTGLPLYELLKLKDAVKDADFFE